MKKGQFLLVVLVALISGGIGGIVVHRLFSPEKTTEEREVTAMVSPEPGSVSVPVEPLVNPPAAVDASMADQLQEQFARVAEYATPGVVLITAKKKVGVYSGFEYRSGRRRIDYYDVPSGQGSGFFIRPDGIVLTNYHVVRDHDSFVVTTADGREYPATVIGVDPPSDLAVLRLDAGGRNDFRVLKFADPDSLKIGHWTIAIGSPLGLPRTLTVGVVSSMKRSDVGVNMYENYIQTDASINPGNSGGPLLNINGEVIGVNDFIMSPSGGNIGLSFAISAEIAERVADEMIRNGYVERPWLGVTLRELAAEQLEELGLEHGAMVENIYRDSPAAEVLRPGDIIVEVDAAPVISPHDLRNRIFGAAPGDNLTMKVWRDRRIQELSVKLQRSPRNWFKQNFRNNVLHVRSF